MVFYTLYPHLKGFYSFLIMSTDKLQRLVFVHCSTFMNKFSGVCLPVFVGAIFLDVRPLLGLGGGYGYPCSNNNLTKQNQTRLSNVCK